MGRRFIDVDVAAAASASVEVDARARGVVRGRFFDGTRCLELGSRSGGGSMSISMPMKASPVSALPRFMVDGFGIHLIKVKNGEMMNE